MKLLCIADHVDPIIYSTGLKARFPDVDLVLSAGDLSLDYYDFIVSSLNKPLYFVFGNHHLEDSHRYRRPADPFAPLRRTGARTAWVPCTCTGASSAPGGFSSRGWGEASGTTAERTSSRTWGCSSSSCGCCRRCSGTVSRGGASSTCWSPIPLPMA